MPMIIISMVDSRSVPTRIGMSFRRAPDAVDDGDQDERQHGAEPGRLGRRGAAAVERDHDAGQQDRRRAARAAAARSFLAEGIVSSARSAERAPPPLRLLGASEFLAVAQHGVDGEHGDQQQPRADAGQEQPAERLLRGDRIEDHGDRGRQQDAERAAGGDDAGGEAAGIAALAHLRNAGRADRRAGRGRRAGHGGEQRAGEDVGDAEAAGDAVQPGVQRGIEVLARIATCRSPRPSG